MLKSNFYKNSSSSSKNAYFAAKSRVYLILSEFGIIFTIGVPEVSQKGTLIKKYRLAPLKGYINKNKEIKEEL